MNDNVYPNDGRYFAPTVPTAQKKAIDAEIEATLEQLPLLKEIVERLDKQIAFYESVNSVPDEAMTTPDEFMHIIAANKLTRQNLMQERTYILARIERTAKR